MERLRQKATRAMTLEQTVKDLKQMLALERKRNDMSSAKSNAYDWLREQELMLMTSEGVKYLKGEDLDAYVDSHRAPIQESWLNTMAVKVQQSIAAGMVQALVDETHATDAFTYTTNGRMLYGSNTRKES